MTTEQIRLAAEMRRKGISLRGVARELGLSEKSVRNAEEIDAARRAMCAGAIPPRRKAEKVPRWNGRKLDFDCVNNCPRAAWCARKQWERGGERAEWTMHVAPGDPEKCAWFVDRFASRIPMDAEEDDGNDGNDGN